MSQDEIAVMDGSKCIMQLRGVRPFFSDKFDITKHKQYPMLSDYDKKNEFDIEKYVKNLNKLRSFSEKSQIRTAPFFISFFKKKETNKWAFLQHQ